MRVIWVIAVVTGVVLGAAPPTFSKDVLRVLEHNCQNCNHAEDAAPKGASRPARKRAE
jgi:hypothetical protein